MTQPIGVAIVGTGLSATQHAAALANVPLARVVAVAGTSRVKAGGFAERWRIPRGYASIEDLLRDPQVDLAHLCTPPDRRLALVEACAAAGAPRHARRRRAVSAALAQAHR